MATSHVAVALMTTLEGDPNRASAQSWLRTVLANKKVEHQEVDGSDEANKALRDKLFELSGKRGSYPQVFLQKRDTEEYQFVGLFEDVQNANEISGMVASNPDFASNPEVVAKTFEKVFESAIPQ
mmetsp:Transcript_11929/g.29940  ORF Transcript_11929/g.29940 Transcript_11929/m.29940 type:complete len:125 (+) Transcript_11929:24-398(+)